MIKFLCPNGHQLSAPENLAGKPGKCPKCSTAFVVPAPAEEEEEAMPPQPAAAVPNAAGGGSSMDIGMGSGKGKAGKEVFVFLCPNGHKLNGPPSLKGKPGQCPHCGAKFRIPSDDDLAPPTRFRHDPTRTGKDVVGAGEVYRVPGSFTVRYDPVAEGRATVVFAWTDRVRPNRPVVVAPNRVRAGRAFRVAWRTADAGSGVASCVVRVDGRIAARVESGVSSAVIAGAKRGTLRVAVACTDRAGNPNRASIRLVRVVR